ncbi:uncharacterized protein LOC130382809 isoform X1 [Gadus chalcogrammus]|uniref:uncharacterized protein LOC130382809 isoform X1 n=1 Tax=Gadus chalcogrammus TaxID=1042646 RepID=UPI0024C395FF|nr:uncharacterized protein LOC130382809 isoform X1 [Gadus chalcogrammus]
MKKAKEGSLARFRDIPSPFSEMVKKNITLKRRLDDSCLDDSIETPAKKPCIPSTASPDLGLGCDSFNVDTPEIVFRQVPLKRQRAIRRLTEHGLTGLKAHLNLSSSSETSDGTPPIDVVSKTNSRPSSYTVNRGNVFDFHIDNILCLSPITCDAGQATGAAANYVKGCLCHRSHGPPALNAPAGQQRGAGVREEEPSANRSEGKRTSNGAAAAVQVNGGQLSHGPLPFLGEVGGSSQPLLEPLKLRQVHAASLEENQDVRAGLGTNSAPSAPSRAVVEALDVKVEMVCDAPLFESTICESAALEEANTAENSFEDSLPLKVQVKSLVVVKNRHASRETAQALSRRPMPFHSEWDWNQKKRLYMESIDTHTQENSYQGNNKSRTAVTEMLHLRSALGEKLGPQWQHPSDLTTRNHQKRFGNSQGPRMSLAEWKAQSSRTHQGFSMVPQIFQRGPIR